MTPADPTREPGWCTKGCEDDHTAPTIAQDWETLLAFWAGSAFEALVARLHAQYEKDQDVIRASVEVLQYVSRGRRFVDVEPYPDAKARMILGGISTEGEK